MTDKRPGMVIERTRKERIRPVRRQHDDALRGPTRISRARGGRQAYRPRGLGNRQKRHRSGIFAKEGTNG